MTDQQEKLAVAELVNWARWCWQGAYPHPLPPSRCRSLESQYKHPPQWGEERLPAAVQANEKHAMIVQRVYQSLDPRWQLVMAAEYPRAHEFDHLSLNKKAESLKVSRDIYLTIKTKIHERVWYAMQCR